MKPYLICHMKASVDTHHDEAAAHCEPVDRRGYRLGVANGRRHGSRAAEAVEC